MSTSRILAEFVGFDSPPAGPFTGGLTCTQKFVQKSIQEGDGDDQIRAILCFKQQLAPSGSLAIDFTTVEVRYGVALAATDVVAGIVEN